MSAQSDIEWTDAKLCAGCNTKKPASGFARDASRRDGLTYRCKLCRNNRAKALYDPRPRPMAGRRYVSARNDDRRQARRRVNHLVNVGALTNPNDVACVDCGHIGVDRRHEYDHYLGYAPEHHESVDPVCSRCHHARERRRSA